MKEIVPPVLGHHPADGISSSLYGRRRSQSPGQQPGKTHNKKGLSKSISGGLENILPSANQTQLKIHIYIGLHNLQLTLTIC